MERGPAGRRRGKKQERPSLSTMPWPQRSIYWWARGRQSFWGPFQPFCELALFSPLTIPVRTPCPRWRLLSGTQGMLTSGARC